MFWLFYPLLYLSSVLIASAGIALKIPSVFIAGATFLALGALQHQGQKYKEYQDQELQRLREKERELEERDRELKEWLVLEEERDKQMARRDSVRQRSVAIQME